MKILISLLSIMLISSISQASFYCVYNDKPATLRSACDALADRGNLNAQNCLEWVIANKNSNFQETAVNVCVAIAKEGFVSHMNSCFEMIKNNNFSEEFLSSCVRMARGRLPNQALDCLDGKQID